MNHNLLYILVCVYCLGGLAFINHEYLPARTSIIRNYTELYDETNAVVARWFLVVLTIVCVALVLAWPLTLMFARAYNRYFRNRSGRNGNNIS